MSHDDPRLPGAKPRAEVAATTVVGVRMAPSELEVLDANRGTLDRSAYIRRCVLLGTAGPTLANSP